MAVKPLSMTYATPKRLILSAVIARAKRPLTPEDIRKEARKQIPTIGIATVYRALKQFVAEGQVRQVEIQGAPPHYENAGQHHHHFFFCLQCRRMFNLLGCVHGIHRLAPAGFAVKRHEIVLYGDCADCRKRA